MDRCRATEDWLDPGRARGQGRVTGKAVPSASPMESPWPAAPIENAGPPRRDPLRRLFFSLAIITAGVSLVSAVLFAWLFFEVRPILSDLQHARLNLKKPITATVDAGFPVHVAFDHRFDFRLRKDIPLELPVRTALRVPLDETFVIPIPDSFAVEMESPLFIDEQIRVRAEMPLDMTVQTRILGMDLSIPIKGSVPVDLAFPLRQEIGVRGPLSLRVTEPLRVQVRQAITVPVRFLMRGVLPLDEQITVPIKTEMEGQIAIRDPLPCTVEMNIGAKDWGRGIRLAR